MRYDESPPPPALRPFVRRFWALADDASDPARAPERVVPDGRMELVVHLGPPFTRLEGPARTGRQPRALLAGQLLQPLLLQPGVTVDLFALTFHPWGAHALLGVDPSALFGTLASLEDVIGPDAARLVDALARAEGFEARRAAAARWCRQRLAAARLPPRPLALAAHVALQAPGAASVSALAEQVGWGARRLERAFAEHVGLAPKACLRVGRVQRVLAALDAPGAPSLAALALDHGYVDQAHLTRDFARLVGTTPARYRTEAHRLEDLLLDGGR